MLNIVIIGAGGFAREVYQWASTSFDSEKYTIKGFISNQPTDLDGFSITAKILASDQSYHIEANDRFILAIGDIVLRKKLADQFKQRGAQFINLMHHTAVIAPTAKLGEGVIICPFVTISDHVTIGDFSLLNYYASCGHDAIVGRYNVLSPYATLNGHAQLEDEVLLGTHVTVTAASRVGQKTKINANSAVMNNIPAGSFVYGVPGKHKTIFQV